MKADDSYIQRIYNHEVLPFDDVKWICETSSNILLTEPTVIEVNGPVIVVGDVHAQLDGVIHIFKNFGAPENHKYVFLGDYVDRGNDSVGTITLLLAMKIKLKDDFIMIRGNHEDVNVSAQYQFRDEIIKKYKNATLLNFFNNVFEALPMGVLINNTILGIHGGLGPAVRTVDSIREIRRPFILTNQDAMYDICWADPQKGLEDWGNGKRGGGCAFGEPIVKEFFERANITGIIRGHEVAMEGYIYPFGEEVNFVTLFSAPCYGVKNKGAVLFIDEGGNYTFKQFMYDEETKQYSSV
ncbi:Serine/threonine-protein phosphatase PP2A catalytic subunit [Tritrichomonas foetus]|uniref:Serine/threonine-protein phosphatase n=1 Tax=Tritrichomonas foetus TaxID=1144522 RepID=A0A1J4K463_9EUKA|nr:Serine/threonine-protein phosphatase PP2A catalytic subunit [Tritrichomonas foetus]|eukprot:OHT05632.1 Serine/threonine-protein phosphatase PP2A catalytic subunit [Tritrichomonas foetus]